jgi:hypothetical protein
MSEGEFDFGIPLVHMCVCICILKVCNIREFFLRYTTIQFTLLYFKDIDECKLGSSGCDHECHNTPGTYHCECKDGFYLDTDNKTCNGKFSNSCIKAIS